MSERDKKEWLAIKSDPKRHAELLERKRAQRQRKKAGETARKRRWRAANKEANNRIRQAQHAVETELRAGRMVRPEACEKCGAVGPVQGHHPSYAREDWLKVLWLCVICHTAEHQPPDRVTPRISRSAQCTETGHVEKKV